jgi:hypothetical protein
MTPDTLLQPMTEGLDALLTLHRAKDSYIAVAPNKAFNKPAWFRVRELPEYFPEYIRDWFNDSYLTVNTFKDQGRGAWRRSEDRVEYLAAAYGDLDCYERHLTEGQAIGAIVDMIGAGRLPQPSITIHSGRGVWVLWCLCGEDGGPLPASDENRERYHDLQLAINRELKHLGADRQSTDLARYCRAPCTFNTKPGGGAVVWDLHGVEQPGGAVKAPRYSLPGLFKAFGLDALADPIPGELIRPARERSEPAALPAPKEVRPGRVVEIESLPKGRHIACWRARLVDLRTLLALRGSIRVGERNTFARAWYVCLRRCGVEPRDAKATIRAKLYQHFEQRPGERYRVREVYGLRTAPAAGYDRRGRWRNDSLAERLGVSREEAKELKTILPAEVRAEREKAHKAASIDRMAERRSWRKVIGKALAQNGAASLRQLAELAGCSHEQARRIKAGLGYEANRRRGRKPTGAGLFHDPPR